MSLKTKLAACAFAASVALAGAAHADGPITGKYYSNYSELYGVGIIFDNGSLFQTTQSSSINNFSNPDPQSTNSDPLFPSGNTNFAVDFESSLTVASGGTYTFSMTSDDGGYLYVDGALVASAPGNHLPETSTGDVTLTAGLHTLGLSVDNAGGPCCVQATVALPSGVSYGAPTISAAPEPGAWVLMFGGVGLAGLALRRRNETGFNAFATA